MSLQWCGFVPRESHKALTLGVPCVVLPAYNNGVGGHFFKILGIREAEDSWCRNHAINFPADMKLCPERYDT